MMTAVTATFGFIQIYVVSATVTARLRHTAVIMTVYIFPSSVVPLFIRTCSESFSLVVSSIDTLESLSLIV